MYNYINAEVLSLQDKILLLSVFTLKYKSVTFEIGPLVTWCTQEIVFNT